MSSAEFTQHLSDFHTQEKCEHCGAKAWGTVGLSQHLESCHALRAVTDLPSTSPPTPSVPLSTPSAPDITTSIRDQLHPASACLPAQEMSPADDIHPQDVPAPTTVPKMAPEPLLPACVSAPPPAAPGPPLPLRSPDVSQARFLPKTFLRVIKPGDREWIAHILYQRNGQLRQDVRQNWHHPPSPTKSVAPPDPQDYFRQRMFLWAPMRMWGIPLKCSQCNRKMHHSGIYTKVREVIDLDSKYYLVGGDYPRCSKCMVPVCPWSSEILNQLDPSHRLKFPAVLTTHLALDRKCVAMLKPRTVGNSSSYTQQALQELHSEDWARRSIDYLADCEFHRRSVLAQSPIVYAPPPPYHPLPLAQWFETAHANEILGHLGEMKAIITCTYGRILKLDSTKKVKMNRCKFQLICSDDKIFRPVVPLHLQKCYIFMYSGDQETCWRD